MFRHLCSACEKIVRIVLTDNGGSVYTSVRFILSFILAEHPPSERHAVERKYMIGRKYL